MAEATQSADTVVMTIKVIRCRTCLAEWFDKVPDRWGNLKPGTPTCRCGQRGWEPDWQPMGEQSDGSSCTTATNEGPTATEANS